MAETPKASPELQLEDTSRERHDATGIPEQVFPDEVEQYPKGAKFAVPIFAVCLIFVAIGIDSTIVGIAVPRLTKQFGTLADMGWYLSIYRLTSGAFQPLFGKLYSFLPPKILVILSLAIFMTAAVLSAVSSTSSLFIFARALAGLATAGVTSGNFAIIIQLTPLRSRSKYASIGAAAEAVASLTAPMLGGFLLDRLSWPWCFYIELPFLAVAFFLLLLTLRSPRRSRQRKLTAAALLEKIEPYSTPVLMAALTCLLLALQWGGSRYAWTEWRILLPLGLFACLVPAYIALQFILGDTATMPRRILARRSVLFGFLFAACNNGALSVIEYYLPTYLQLVEGKSATLAGILLLPLGLGLVISVPLAGFLTYYVGYPNPFMILNGIITPIATGLLTTVDAAPALWKLLVYQALLGFGTGIGFQGPQVVAQTVLSYSDSQIGISIIQLAQALGPAVFVAAAQTVFSSNLPADLISDQEGLASSTPIGGDLSYLYSEALGTAFFVSVGLSGVTIVAALGMEWRSTKKRTVGVDDA